MKITCQSCQSKYTVSDEKVQGKTVKIKCRKCGATILVNSGGVTTNAPADPVSLSSGGQADGGSSYLVNVADGDQRSMTLPEIVAAYQTSVVTADTYVWADGMGDWQPLGQVDTIVAALHAQPAAQAAPAQVAAAGGGMDVEHRAAARRDQARPAQDPFGARQEEVASSAPAYTNGSAAVAAMRAAPAPAPVAARPAEENSMLFSLSALTAKPAASAPKATTARDKEDSGIIDLKALAASASVPAQPAAAAFLPDGGLFPLGAPIVAAPAAAPPVTTPTVPPPKSKAPLFLGIGGVVAVGAIVGAFLIMKGSPPPPPAAPAVTETAAPTATATAAPTTTASADATAAPTASAEASAAPTSSAVAKAGKGGKAPAGGGGKAAPAAGGGKAGPAAAAPAPAPAGPKKGNCGCAAGDLMCAMKCSAGK